MTVATIDYQAGPRHRRRRTVVKVLLIAAAIFSVLSVPVTPVARTRSRIDAITGTMEWQTTWPLGLTRGPALDVSPLELRLKKMGTPYARDWRFLHNTHRTVFGRAMGYECGSAPPIYSLRPVLQDFANVSSDEQVRELVRVLTTGTEAEQRAAVDRELNRF